MTPDEFERRMRDLFPPDCRDKESAHWEADKLMCDLLRSLGYGGAVEVFESAAKYYA